MKMEIVIWILVVSLLLVVVFVGFCVCKCRKGSRLLAALQDHSRNTIEELDARRQQLEENRTLLDLSLAASHLIAWECNMETGIISSEHEHSIFFTKHYTVWQYIDERVATEHQELFRNAINQILNKVSNTLDVTVQFLYEDKYEWMHIIGQTVAGFSDHNQKVVGTSQFITEEVAKQAELEHLRCKAEQSSLQKTAFLANMGHEIRTPLNAIVGFANLLAEEAATEESQEYGRIIKTNTELLMQLVDDILDVARIEAGKMEFHLSDVDLCCEFADLEQTYRLKMPKGVRFVYEPSESCYTICTDKNRLIQVLSNLLNNALKYTLSGVITMGYSAMNDRVRIYVRDTGKGIAAESLSKVFLRFAKFDSSVSGTGLGLSICQTIVQHLGGEIGVSSELGKGSEFWFTLPLKKQLK